MNLSLFLITGFYRNKNAFNNKVSKQDTHRFCTLYLKGTCNLSQTLTAHQSSDVRQDYPPYWTDRTLQLKWLSHKASTGQSIRLSPVQALKVQNPFKWLPRDRILTQSRQCINQNTGGHLHSSDSGEQVPINLNTVISLKILKYWKQEQIPVWGLSKVLHVENSSNKWPYFS